MYFIIFGTRGITYTKESGEFHCPSCEARAYRQRRVRRFFTLYFIPLIPLDLLGEYIECDHCRSTYELEVLQHDPSRMLDEFEAKYYTAVKNTMLLMMLADGVIDDGELEMICNVYESITNKAITEEAVRKQAAELEAAGTTVADFLGAVGPMLNDPGREMVVKAAFSVAVADGEFDDSEKELLMEIADAMHMTPAHASGVLSALIESFQTEADGDPGTSAGAGEQW